MRARPPWIGCPRSRSAASRSLPRLPRALERLSNQHYRYARHVDFTVEVDAACECWTGGRVFEAWPASSPNPRPLWRQADRYRVPRICFINKLDRTGADFWRCVDMIANASGRGRCRSSCRSETGEVPRHRGPDHHEGDRLSRGGPGRRVGTIDIPADMVEAARAHRERWSKSSPRWTTNSLTSTSKATR